MSHATAPVSTEPSGTRSGVEIREGPGLRQRLLRTVEEGWPPAAVLVGIGVLWWFVTAQEWIAPYLVPPPRAVTELFNSEWSFLMGHTWVTTYETVVGFGLAVLFGLASAVAIVYSRAIERSLYPILLFAQVVPKIAIAPLFVVWLGFGPTPKILVAMLIAFFPVVISGVAGFRSVDPEMLELSATMGASPIKTFRKIRFPSALPHIFSGVKVAATLAVVGAVVGEFVGANEGLGYVLLVANGNLNGPLLWAGLILMTLIGIVLFLAIEVAEKLVLPWHASQRTSLAATT